MKRQFLQNSLILLFLVLPMVSVFAQANSSVQGSFEQHFVQDGNQVTEENKEAEENEAQIKEDEGKGFFSTVQEIIYGIILLLIFVGGPFFMIGHMIYVLIDTRRLKNPTLVAAFVSARQKKGLSETASKDENEQCSMLLDSIYENYSISDTDENGDEIHRPSKMREVLKAHKMFKKATLLMPTDEAVVEQYNNHKACLYDNMKRSFFSSWKLIILCLIIAVLVGFAGDNGWVIGFLTYGAFFWIPCIVYYLSGNVPQFMIDKKEARGGGGGWFAAALVGLGIGILGSGQTVRTRYTDGSYEDDNSSHWIALVLGLFVLLIVACTIYIWSLVNYLRNYVFYI